ncbi:MAG: DUF1015 domain-containing protein [Elusimicrobia bacterium]|nr:DUF1015 domain-containing protein [Elusimicrobiota bacterium]
MLRIEPFRGIRFNSRRVPLTSALCPPYDVIAPDMAKRLRRIRENTIHIELPAGTTDAKYRRAARTWTRWMKGGTLIQDTAPAFYVLEQRFRLAGRPMRRTGILAALGLAPSSARRVVPHEKTLSKPKKDRLKLLAALGVNTSPIFAIYTDPRASLRSVLARIVRGEPDARGKAPDGVTLRLWRISDPAVAAGISAAFAPKTLLIADGHHRFEVARRSGERSIMCYLCAEEDAGLAVLPTHRVLDEGGGVPAQIRSLCRLTRVSSLARLQDAIRRAPSPFAFGVVRKKEFTLAVPSPSTGKGVRSRLGVEWLSKRLFEKVDPHLIRYTHDAKEAARWGSGNGGLAILVKPVAVRDIRVAVERAGLLPQKSTYFFPKVEAGAVFKSAK